MVWSSRTLVTFCETTYTNSHLYVVQFIRINPALYLERKLDENCVRSAFVIPIELLKIGFL